MADRHKAMNIPFRCPVEMVETVEKIAKGENKNRSEVLRRLVAKGLVAEGYKQDEDSMKEAMQAALREVLMPQVKRLASISAKATQLSSAAFFLLVFIGRLYLPEDQRGLLDDVAADARKLGAQYLQLKNMDIDDFIDKGIKSMIDEE